MRRNQVMLMVVALSVAVPMLCSNVWRKSQPYEQGLHTNLVETVPSLAGRDLAHVGSCRAFPADNIWNTPVDQLKLDPKSSLYITSIGASSPMHADFGSSMNYGIPYTQVPSGTQSMPIEFEDADESDPGPYPIPRDAPIEGDGKGDSHVIFIDVRRCVLYELYSAHRKGDGWRAGSGIAMKLNDNALRSAGKTSADAAGLPIFPGLVRFEEVMSGQINHALRFTLPSTQNTYLWPARHQAGSADPKLAPMGQRFRLRSSFDTSRFSKPNQVIMAALKKYGMLLADNGSPMYLSGVSDKRWNDRDLHRLGAMTAADFEAVDESDLQMSTDSGRVNSLALKQY